MDPIDRLSALLIGLFNTAEESNVLSAKADSFALALLDPVEHPGSMDKLRCPCTASRTAIEHMRERI